MAKPPPTPAPSGSSFTELVAGETVNTSSFTGPSVNLPTTSVSATVHVHAFGGYGECSIALDGLVGGVWQVVGQMSQNSWGQDGWGARIDLTSPLPTALRTRILECGGQHIGVSVETS